MHRTFRLTYSRLPSWLATLVLGLTFIFLGSALPQATFGQADTPDTPLESPESSETKGFEERKSSASLPSDYNDPIYQFTPLTEKKSFRRRARAIISTLFKQHYIPEKLEVIDEEILFESLLKELDPEKRIFTASQVENLREENIAQLRRSLRSGHLKGVFHIYNAWRAQLRKIYHYQLDLIQEDLIDLDKEESLTLSDRDDAVYLTTDAEWEDYWRKVLKSNYVSRIINFKDRERAAYFQTVRLRSRLRNLTRLDEEDVFNTFSRAIVTRLDPHTTYLTPKDAKLFRQTLGAKLEGIGAVLSEKDGYIEIVRLIPGGPAIKSNAIFPGDRIISVSDDDSDGILVEVVGIRLAEVVNLIKGPKGTPVVLELIGGGGYGGEIRRVELIRDIIELEDQRASSSKQRVSIDDKEYTVTIIELPRFYGPGSSTAKDAPSTTRDVYNLIVDALNDGTDGIVLDLRNNGGGYLDEAIKLSSLFLDGGKVVLVRDRNGSVRTYGKHSLADPLWRKPIMVMVNRLSASASEIVAAAIQDYGRGLVVGTQTFGKGTVQEGTRLESDFGEMNITRMIYYRVNGGSPQFAGVTPDIELVRLWNPEMVGESSYDFALIPDPIVTEVPRKNTDTYRSVEPLTVAHLSRQATDPEMQYLMQRYAYSQSLQDRTQTPLDLERYQARLESDREESLDLRNELRQALNKPIFSDWDEYDDYIRDQAKDPDRVTLEERVFRREAATILAQAMYLDELYTLQESTATVPHTPPVLPKDVEVLTEVIE